MMHGGARTETIHLTTRPAGGRLWGTAAAAPQVTGLTVTPAIDGASCDVEVRVDTTFMDAGRSFSGAVRLDTNAGTFDVPLTFRTMFRWDTVAGWTVGLGLTVGCLMAWCRGALAASASSLRGWLLSYPSRSATDLLWACGVFAVVFVAGVVGFVKVLHEIQKSG